MIYLSNMSPLGTPKINGSNIDYDRILRVLSDPYNVGLYERQVTAFFQIVDANSEGFVGGLACEYYLVSPIPYLCHPSSCQSVPIKQ